MSSIPIVRSIGELQAVSDRVRAAGQRIALVPTMGALHVGHLSLMKVAREQADVVWVSIFVNPTQFNDPADFNGYPVDFDNDVALCERGGADLVFAPTGAEMYPDGAQTWVEVSDLAEPLCGATRPGHFRGVTTIVTKLFHAASPHVAVFGEKDFQQLVVIRRMVGDLGFGIEIVGAPTVREPDGLALSSRNARLGPEARRQAVTLVRALDAADDALAAGETDRDALRDRVEVILGRASQACVDYAELRDPVTLELAPPRLEGPTLLALAVRFSPDPDGRGSEVRLIDNRVLNPKRAGTTAEECA
jgi:pantoate--beta-alanine ligase